MIIKVNTKPQRLLSITTDRSPNVKVLSDGPQVVIEHGLSEVAIGHGLMLEETNNGPVLSVNIANEVEEDNTLPVTSAAVYTEIGNIDALLQTI